MSKELLTKQKTEFLGTYEKKGGSQNDISLVVCWHVFIKIDRNRIKHSSKVLNGNVCSYNTHRKNYVFIYVRDHSYIT